MRFTNQEVSSWILQNAEALGRKAPAIADALISEFYGSAVKPLKDCGGYSHFRNGVCEHVRKILKGWAENRGKKALSADQLDFSKIDVNFRPLVSKINRESVYIPSSKTYEPLVQIIEANNSALIKEAFNYLRQGAKDDLRVADLLEELYYKMLAKKRH